MILDVLSCDFSVFAPHFLEASAGTGKTFAIEHIVARLLLEAQEPFQKLFSLEEILVVTFTRAATRELKARIHRNLKNAQDDLMQGSSSIDYLQALIEKGLTQRSLERLKEALLCYDTASIYTLHGFCARILREFALESKTGSLVSDPDEISSQSALLEWIEEYLKQQEALKAYSPVQLQKLLGRFRKDPKALKMQLARLASHAKPLAQLPSYLDYHSAFSTALQGFFRFEESQLAEDFWHLSGCYTKMLKKQMPSQIALWAKVLSTRSCSEEQFDQLLLSETFLEKMHKSSLKKRLKEGALESVHYSGLVEEVQKKLAPFLRKARDTTRILLRLSQEIQQQTRNAFEKKGVFSPDLLLIKAQEALDSPPFLQRVQQKFKAAIVDEFQDTDTIQWELIQTLFSQNKPLYLVGDPKQSIYAFRNADVHTYLQAKEVLGANSLRILNTNYRSTPSLVGALNTLFGKAHTKWMSLPGTEQHLQVLPVDAGSTSAPLKGIAPLTCFIAKEKKGRSRKFPSSSLLERGVFPYIAREILTLHTEHNIPYHEMAVLIKDRFQAERLTQFLKQAHIPAHFQRSGVLTESEGYLSLIDILQAVYHARNSRYLKTALATPLIGWTESLLTKPLSDPLVLQAAFVFKQLQSTLFEKGIACFLEDLYNCHFLEKGGSVLEELFERGEKQVYFDLRGLLEHVLTEEAKGSVDYLSFLKKLRFESDESSLQTASCEEKNAVKLMSVHKSKGLEFEVVFALGPSCRHIGSDFVAVREKAASVIVPYEEEDPSCQLALFESDVEKLRLFYVALTRARRKLYLPLFFQEPQQLKEKNASGSELFLANCFAEPQTHDEIYTALEDITAEKAFDFLQELSSDIEVITLATESQEKIEAPLEQLRVEVDPPPPTCFAYKSTPVLSFSSIAPSATLAPAIVLPSEHSIHSLPPGAKTGVFVHSLLEQILKRGLHHPLNSVAIQELTSQLSQGTSFQEWVSILKPWIIDLLQKPLQGFCLSDIPADQMHYEMEFLYPCKAGWMKGFSDLLFCANDKYYLLDWKTNWLGPTDADYTSQAMQKSVEDHHYKLQAAIYSEGFRRYVKLFDNRPFESCFGGALYYFVRGKAHYHFQVDTYE